MNLSQIDQLIAISEQGGLRAAARALGLSAPALAKGLNALEQEFGVELVQRSVRGVSFTRYGLALLQRARAIRAEIARSHDEIAQMRGGKAGDVAIGVSPVAAALVLPSALLMARRQYPELRLRVTDTLYPEALERLRNGELDLFIGPMPRGHSEHVFDVRPLFFSHLAVLGRPDHPMRHAQSMQELEGSEWLILGVLAGPGGLVQEIFAESGLPSARIAMASDSMTAIFGFLQSTDMLALLPERLAGPGGPLSAAAKPFESVQIQPQLRASLVTLADKPLTPAAQHLVAALLNAACSLTYR